MFHNSLHLRRSPLSGRGVFAAADLPADAVVEPLTDDEESSSTRRSPTRPRCLATVTSDSWQTGRTMYKYFRAPRRIAVS